MTSGVTRRAFLLGAAGAATAGWIWLRGGEAPTAAPVTSSGAPPTTVPPATTTPPPTTMAAPTTTTTTTATTSTTAAPAVQIEALCRDAWGAAAPTGAFREHTVDRLTVHHTARLLGDNRQAPAAIRGHQRFHQGDRGWADIAYHFIIDLEGNVYECRPVGAVGDTATDYDPTGHFLVCCEGDFNSQQLPAAQRQALVGVLAWAATEYGAAPATIRGHRDLAATSCPGDNLQTLIASGELAAAVVAAQAAGVTLEVVCGAEAAGRVEAIEA